MSNYLKLWRKRQNLLEVLAQSSDEDTDDHETETTLQLDEQESNIRASCSSSDGDNNEWSDSNSSFEEEEDYGYNDTVIESDPEDVGTNGSKESENESPDIKDKIREWFRDNRPSREGASNLLKILASHGHRVPKDYRTLMDTPCTVQCENLSGGTYIYFGIATALEKHLGEGKLFFEDMIELSFNVDGVPLFKSTLSGFWPILGMYEGYQPFTIALWYGVGKPEPLEEYIEEFLQEVKLLLESGFHYKGKHYGVTIKAFICDAPARAYLKCVKGHTAKVGCDRCQIVGTWEGRVVYNTGKTGDAKTDYDFMRFGYQGYQTRLSPLIKARILCVQQFSLEYMHIGCLGIAKRMLTFLRQGPTICKLRRQEKDAISDKLENLSGKMPSEFARQPRSLKDLDRWKATEFRQFILYTGPVVLRNSLSKELYEHFLTFSIGLGLMLESDDDRRNHYLDYAKGLINSFVAKCPCLYGPTFTVYNVHCLLHLYEDVEFFGCSLNEISAFPFENYLQTLKRYVRNSRNPVAQVAKRLAEIESIPTTELQARSTFNVISTRRKDSCFLLSNNDTAVVKAKRDDGKFECNVLKQSRMHSFFTKPCESKIFNIAYTTSLEYRAKRMILCRKDLVRKVVCLPFNEGFVLFPMLHGVEHA